jgi:hypothetical protein
MDGGKRYEKDKGAMEKERHNARGDRVSLFSHADGIGDYLRKDDDASKQGNDGGIVSKAHPEIIDRIGGQLNRESPDSESEDHDTVYKCNKSVSDYHGAIFSSFSSSFQEGGGL